MTEKLWCGAGHPINEVEARLIDRGKIKLQPCGCPVRPIQYVAATDKIQTKPVLRIEAK